MRIRRQEFELLVRRAYKELPRQFRSLLADVDVIVEEQPSSELRQSLGLEPDEVLFGLYDGTPLTNADRYSASILMPDRIILYQRTFERECDSPLDVLDEVRKTIMHEAGHHFGLDEAHLEDV